MARDALDMMLPIAQRASIGLSLGLLPEATEHVDYGQRLRVLGKLVSNALKYSPAGRLVLLGASRTGDSVLLTVADRAVGMNEQEVAQAFDHGWQSANPRPRGDAAGLGLSIVKSLLAQQQGSVAIRSTPGVATVVTVRLPCRCCRACGVKIRQDSSTSAQWLEATCMKGRRLKPQSLRWGQGKRVLNSIFVRELIAVAAAQSKRPRTFERVSPLRDSAW